MMTVMQIVQHALLTEVSIVTVGRKDDLDPRKDEDDFWLAE